MQNNGSSESVVADFPMVETLNTSTHRLDVRRKCMTTEQEHVGMYDQGTQAKIAS